MLSVVTDADLEDIARAFVRNAKLGEHKALRALPAYVLGNPGSVIGLQRSRLWSTEHEDVNA